MPIKNLLIKYWGYSSFRPLQEEIIRSVMEGRDTLALLPTGGGKSICYQVPALAMDGICIVISPLIALMKDQVENLKKKNIKAVSIHSGMPSREISMILDNCSYGNVKLLYVSPERLASEDFRTRLRKMKVSLIAVDEAHCISQWGYDFRPPYLQIAAVRDLFPKTPVLALTATATPPVIVDIQARLNFTKPKVFVDSFFRKNLTYYVIKEEDKRGRLLRILKRSPGSGIIYVRSRKKTAEIAAFLKKNGVSADFYHAGLDPKQRSARQDAWMKNSARVMVATNAFGMGIDKPDVRFIVHLDLPESIEAYFQEAGRAGRDGKNSFSVILHDQSDLQNLRLHFTNTFPNPEMIRKIYNALGNFVQVPLGGGADQTFDFDLPVFCAQYKFNQVMTFNALKFLEREGYLLLSDDFDKVSRILFLNSKEDLYRFQVQNAAYDPMIKTMLRSYSGLFNEYTNIYESEIATRTETGTDSVIKQLQYLDSMKVISYLPAKALPQIVFCNERMDEKTLQIGKENYYDRKENARKRIDAVINYADKSEVCRSVTLLEYFGEKNTTRCGGCDVCLKRNKMGLSELEFENVKVQVRAQLTIRSMLLTELLSSIKHTDENQVIKVIRWMIDNEMISVNDEERITLYD